MLLPKLDRSYVSEIDDVLQKLAETVPLSISQQEEIEKYRRIERLRDDPTACAEQEII